MVAMNTSTAERSIYDNVEDAPLVPEYDDGPDQPVTNLDKEQAYRQGFLDEARRIVRDWANPMPPSKPDAKPVSIRELMQRCRCDPFSEIDAAKVQREQLREDYAVYEAGDAGPKTRHLGYRQGHEVPAAEWRGRHHAMAFVLEPWQHLDTADVDVFDPALLRRWLDAVENWASAPIDTNLITPPTHRLKLVRLGELQARIERDAGFFFAASGHRASPVYPALTKGFAATDPPGTAPHPPAPLTAEPHPRPLSGQTLGLSPLRGGTG